MTETQSEYYSLRVGSIVRLLDPEKMGLFNLRSCKVGSLATVVDICMDANDGRRYTIQIFHPQTHETYTPFITKEWFDEEYFDIILL